MSVQKKRTRTPHLHPTYLNTLSCFPLAQSLVPELPYAKLSVVQLRNLTFTARYLNLSFGTVEGYFEVTFDCTVKTLPFEDPDDAIRFEKPELEDLRITLRGKYNSSRNYATRKSLELFVNAQVWSNGWDDDGSWIGDDQGTLQDIPLLKALYAKYGGNWLQLMKL